MLKVSKQLKFKLITLVIAVVEHLNQTRYAKAAWENAYKLSEKEEANDPICQLIARNERQFQIEADYEEDMLLEIDPEEYREMLEEDDLDCPF